VSGSRLRLARWLSARRRAVGALVIAGVETPAGEMAVGKTLRSRATYLALRSAGVETPAGALAVAKTPRSRATYLALKSGGIETAAGGMAVGKTPRSRSSGERRDQDSSWQDGCRQDAVQYGLW